ncbi:unnamed protein product [Paramecium pentaurelia]|uniref:Vps72/YL1 C-terminal domain-containing protein n=1 Tax=Paramecium pentaurelia TaxID=43138 RepID=A0A8S1WEY8_9CILI|nr:unnamed protein product [Paramecium pentaurelia]
MSYQFKNSQWQARRKELKSRRQSQSRKFNNIKAQVQINNSAFNYLSIEAPPSLKPAKKYCDITGFEAKYKDPITQLQYCDSIVFNYIRNFPKASAETYLNIRGCTQKLIS